MSDAPAIDFEFRVILLEPREHSKNFPFHAVCIELNLVGRGGSPEEAISDFLETVQESILDHLTVGSSLAMNPDPALADAFEKQSSEFDGDRVVGGYCLKLRVQRQGKASKTPARLRAKDTTSLLVPAF